MMRFFLPTKHVLSIVLSEFFPSRIPDPGPKSFRIPDPHQSIQVFYQKIGSKLAEILSGILIFYLSGIPEPGVKKAPDPGSGSATRVLSDLFDGRSSPGDQPEAKWRGQPGGAALPPQEERQAQILP